MERDKKTGETNRRMDVPVKFEDLSEAFHFVASGGPLEHMAYLNRETGEFLWHSEWDDVFDPLPEDVDSSGKYVAIPHPSDLELGKPLVLDFAAEFLREDYGKVEEIFSRRGAYARFKDLLEHRGLLDRWYDYENRAQEKALREWCEEEAIRIEEPEEHREAHNG